MNERLYKQHLTKAYRIRNYSSVGSIPSRLTNNYRSDELTMPNDNLRYEIVRLDAKLDMISNQLNHLLNIIGGGKSPTNVSNQTTDISTAEIALMRSLTTKQHCTLQLVERGLRNQDIAHILDVAENTVKLHVRAICKKMGVKNRAQAATIAHDIFMGIDEREYEQLSGGIPLNWAMTLSTTEPDPYAPLYAPTRKDG